MKSTVIYGSTSSSRYPLKRFNLTLKFILVHAKNVYKFKKSIYAHVTSMFWVIVTQTHLNPGRTFKLFSYRKTDNRWNYWFITPGSRNLGSVFHSQPQILMMINLTCTHWLPLVIFKEISVRFCVTLSTSTNSASAEQHSLKRVSTEV